MVDGMVDDLVVAAVRAREKAHAPYSKFKVGAAVLCGGRVFTGCNVENNSYGATVCAERVAVFAAVAAGCTRPTALAVVADTPEPVVPCGMCLQVLSEFSPESQLKLILANTTGQLRELTLAELLPRAFRL